MNRKMFYSTIVAIALMPAALQAQSTSASANASAHSETQVRTPKARIDATMSAAARARIPASLLESKVEEGEAKNVPQERIAAAVEARFQALLKASETMKRANVEATSATDLAVTADAIEAGVSQNALIKISRSAPAERRAVAVATLSGLVQLGHASETALARVTAAVGSNAALANLQAQVASQLQLNGGAGNGAVNGALNAGGIVRIK